MHQRGGYDYRKADLARDLGVSAMTISGWFKNSAPDDSNIQRLALNFGVSAGFIYGLLDRKPPPDYDQLTDEIMAIVYRLTNNRKSELLHRLKEEGAKYDAKKKD